MRFPILVSFICFTAVVMAVGADDTRQQQKSSVVWHNSEGGSWARVYLQSSPFPHASRKSGHTYKNMVFTYSVNYSDSSAIVFIPDNYFSYGGQNDVIVHFHGWGNEVINVMHDFDMPPQLVRSNKNAILIFAQGPKNAMDSAGGKMEEKNGLRMFIMETLDLLKAENRIAAKELGNVIISAHSGGYRPAILGLVNGGVGNKIKEVFLFDAFYDLTDRLIPWLEQDYENKLRSIYTDHLAEEHKEFAKLLSLKGLKYNTVLSRDTKILLKYTRACHDCVIEGNFEKWLKASFLEDRLEN